MRILRAFWPAPLVAGALMGAAFPPLDVGWLMPVAWALLFASMRLRRGERAGMQVFVASLVLFLPGLVWLVPLAWPLWLVVALWCAMWEGLFGRLAGKYLAREGGPGAAWIVVVPMLHLLTDMLRTTVLTGFPWMLPGYAGWRNPVLLGSADLLGVHGATLATLVAAAGTAECACRLLSREGRAAQALVPAVTLWAAPAAWTYGKPSIEERPGPTLLLLQPSIPQQWKEDLVKSGREPTSVETFWAKSEELERRGLGEAAAAGRTIDAVVWAETMVPEAAARPLDVGRPLLNYVESRDHRPVAVPDAGRRLAAGARGAETLAGMVSLAEGDPRFLQFNTVVLIDAEGRIRGFQDKQHLTPGGEYIPFRGLLPFRERFEEYLRSAVGFLPDLRPGEVGNVVAMRGGAKAGVMICYESAYPEVARGLVRAGATFLVNCSNYGWFAHTAEMQQALALCAFRSAELRRTLVLSSNNGISAVIGPDGRVRGTTTVADEPGYLIASAPLCDSTSPFAVVGEWGAWAIGTVGAALAQRRARRRPTGRGATA